MTLTKLRMIGLAVVIGFSASMISSQPAFACDAKCQQANKAAAEKSAAAAKKQQKQQEGRHCGHGDKGVC